MRTRSSSPPIHVHVDEATSVHVHVKSSIRTPQGKTKANIRPTAQDKTRVPWISPGKASVQDASLKWEGPMYCLEITPPRTEPELYQPALQLADLTSEEEEEEEEEEGLHGRISQYQRKIDNLLTEVSSLKSELLERHFEQLSGSQHALLQQEEELAKVSRELDDTEQKMVRSCQFMEKMLNEGECSRHQGKDSLLRKLMEAEVDGAAAAKQVSTLRESVSKLYAAESRLCGIKSSLLACQEELLRQKLGTFEATNRALRHLIREQHDSKGRWVLEPIPAYCERGQGTRWTGRQSVARQLETIQLTEQKDSLLKRLADMEAENAHIVVKLQEKDREVKQLSKLLNAQKDTTRSSANISKSLESTRAHLQGQLRSKAAENNRLSVQIKNLEGAAHKQKAKMDYLSDQLSEVKQQASADRDALKRATRTQKQRAQHSEDTAGQLSIQLLEMEKQLSEALSAAETWQSRFTQEIKDKSKLEAELTLISSHESELMEKLHCAENKSSADREALLDQLHGLTTENKTAKLENQTLKAASSAVEQKLALSQSELQQVKASIKQYKSLLDSYKLQVQKTRAEADEYCAQLAKAELQVEAVRGEFLGRLAELEPLPEALQRSQLLLQEAQDRERNQERCSIELGATLTDLRMKVETQGSQMELVRQKNKVLLEENRQLQLRVESLERKLEEAGSQNTELLAVITKREETIHSNQLRLEEKTRESSLLNRKLEEALNDARQQMSDNRERAATKERSTQAKILGLETQLSRTTSEVNQLRRSKEEVTQRYQSLLQDVKDRLEQTDSTNRSLQNYIQFLKASYATVFGDVALSSFLRAPSPI